MAHSRVNIKNAAVVKRLLVLNVLLPSVKSGFQWER